MKRGREGLGQGAAGVKPAPTFRHNLIGAQGACLQAEGGGAVSEVACKQAPTNRR
jgi:hypothetical protein